MTPYIGEERYYLFVCSKYSGGGARDFSGSSLSLDDLKDIFQKRYERHYRGSLVDVHITNADMDIVATWNSFDGWRMVRQEVA